jgi:hypothetical protein
VSAALVLRTLPPPEPEMILVILMSYFDESGTHGGSPHTVMSGIMGSALQWDRFQTKMESIKRRHGFRVFHAKEFRAARGEFEGWPADRYKAVLHEMSEAFFGLMEAVNCSLPNLDYERDYRGGEKPNKLNLDSAYGLCFRHSLTHLILEAYRRLGSHKNFRETKMHVVLEAGHRNAGDAERIFHEMSREIRKAGSNLLGAVTFAGKDECDPLMIADFMSYGTLKMELAGRNKLPLAGGAPLKPSESKGPGITNIKWAEGDLARLKGKLVKRIEDRAAWGAATRSATPEARGS